MTRLIPRFLLLLSFVSLFTHAVSENTNTRVAQIYKSKKELLLDNDKVQVFRLTYLPGAESGEHQHQHPNRVVYILQGGKLAVVNSDKHSTTKIIEVKAGQTLYLPANHHNVKNIGNTTVSMLETELKAVEPTQP